MSRYIERAECTVRLVDVTLQTLLEPEQSYEDIDYKHWQPILLSLGDESIFTEKYEERNSQNVTYFLTFDRENPSSVFSCIANARENARMIRDQISSEMWETINTLYLFLKKQNANAVCREIRFDFFKKIKESSILFQGITDSTFPHQIGYYFIICGRYIERAEKTCRIIESKQHMTDQIVEKADAIDTAQWAAILKANSAFEAYHRVFVSDIEESSVLQFLILSKNLPRSLFFCIQKLQYAMHMISGCRLDQYSNEAERLTGMLLSKLNYGSPSDLTYEGEDSLLAEIVSNLESIAVELSERYMFFPIVDPAAEPESQTQEQSTVTAIS
ncbi:alpha-E domain-containing protein [Puniceicoccaceae bacterium K14]|nr:alpha-E domain-containing protein [Puniceicoccaceae bacterium K14]